MRPRAVVDWTEAISGSPKVLVVIAHPDDEIFCSGLICALAERGCEIGLLCLTRGEGGAQDGSDGAGLAAVREGELRASAEALGIGQVEFLSYVDPKPRRGTARAPYLNEEVLAEEIATRIKDGDIELVITHGSSGEYWHPGHILLHDCVRSAVPKKVRLVTYYAFDPEHPIQELVNEDDRAHFVCDGGRYREQRKEAVRSHGTQLAVFEHFSGGDVGDFLTLTQRECYRIW